MAVENAENKILAYLKKSPPINTFKLARELGIDRHILLGIIEKLEEKQAIEIRHGNVRFLKFPKAEKPIKAKKAEIKKIMPEAKAITPKKSKALENLQAENKSLKEKISELEISIKRQPYLKSKLREQTELTEKLEKRVEALKEKANVPPKIITREIRVPQKIITRTKVKTIIKKVPVRAKEEKEAVTKKFKLPEFNIAWMKNIQQLEKPEFLEQKIVAGRKINFVKLNKNIQQLHVPEILRNN